MKILIIERKNKITLDNVKLTDTNNQLNVQSTTYKNIFIYQSMSGDADTGTAEFSSKNSTIITNNEAKEIKIVLDASSKITLTGDSYISELEDSDSSYSNIDLNGYKLYINGKELKK